MSAAMPVIQASATSDLHFPAGAAMSKRKKGNERRPARRQSAKEDIPRAQAARGPSYSAMARRLRGLLRLFEAQLEALEAGRDVWDFAVEVGVLRAAAGL